MIDHKSLPYEIRRTAVDLFAGKTGFSLDEMKSLFTEEIRTFVKKQSIWNAQTENTWMRLGQALMYASVEQKLSPTSLSKRDKAFEYWLLLLPLEEQKRLLLDLCAKPNFPMRNGKPTQQQRDRLRAMLTVTVIDSHVSSALQVLNSPIVQEDWIKAVERCQRDPDGAITAARTLLETTCKHLLDECGVLYNPKDDLPKLYRNTAQALNIAPNQQSEQALQQICAGCISVVLGVGTLRNQFGDAHGSGRTEVIPPLPLALFSVNLAGSMAMFLVQTWEASSDGTVLPLP